MSSPSFFYEKLCWSWTNEVFFLAQGKIMKHEIYYCDYFLLVERDTRRCYRRENEGLSRVHEKRKKEALRHEKLNPLQIHESVEKLLHHSFPNNIVENKSFASTLKKSRVICFSLVCSLWNWQQATQQKLNPLRARHDFRQRGNTFQVYPKKSSKP